MHDTAAWLASMEPEAFRELTKVDPVVLFQSDVATADVTDRRALVDTLLALVDEGKVFPYDLDQHRRYHKLDHPELAAQLQSFIGDNSKGTAVRCVAVEIAESCQRQELQDELVRIALDEAEPTTVRGHAARALCHLGNDASRAKLRPLATSEAGDDPADELKGCGLRALWPAHISARELFGILTPPKQENFLGAYRGFLLHELTPHLQPTDLTFALKWVEEQQQAGRLPPAFDRPADVIMAQAWESLHERQVLEAFARAAAMRLRHHDRVVGGEAGAGFIASLGRETEKRHVLLDAIVTVLPVLKIEPLWLLLSDAPLLSSQDVPWMLNQLQAAGSEPIQRIWAQLIERTLDWHSSDQMDAILNASERSDVLREELSWLLKPVELASPEAQRLKERYEELRSLEERRKEPLLLDPPPGVRVTQHLEAVEAGDLSGWWRLNMDMTLEPQSTHYQRELEADLTTLPGWQAADEATRLRIIRTAHVYLLQHGDVTTEWIDTNNLDRPAFAGYRAIRLLAQEAPNLLETSPDLVWQRWAPVILAYPTASDGEDSDWQRRLVGLAYQHAPAEIIATLLRLIDKEDRDHGNVWTSSAVKDCWDERLASAILLKAKDKTLQPGSFVSLLGELLDYQVDEAKAYARALVAVPLPRGEPERLRAVHAARLLLARTEDAGWRAVWPAMQEDAEFGRQVVTSIATDPGSVLLPRLKESQLGDLYLWLVEQFPYSEDPRTEGGHSVGPRESIAWWRDGMVSHLRDRGTPEAAETLHRLTRAHPALEWLKWALITGQR